MGRIGARAALVTDHWDGDFPQIVDRITCLGFTPTESYGMLSSGREARIIIQFCCGILYFAVQRQDCYIVSSRRGFILWVDP